MSIKYNVLLYNKQCGKKRVQCNETVIRIKTNNVSNLTLSEEYSMLNYVTRNNKNEENISKAQQI